MQPTASGRRGPGAARRTASTATSAATTPSAPSNAPPSSTVSTCEPAHTRGSDPASGSIAQRLPAPSCSTSSPSEDALTRNHERASSSSGPHARRFQPDGPGADRGELARTGGGRARRRSPGSRLDQHGQVVVGGRQALGSAGPHDVAVLDARRRRGPGTRASARPRRPLPRRAAPRRRAPAPAARSARARSRGRRTARAPIRSPCSDPPDRPLPPPRVHGRRPRTPASRARGAPRRRAGSRGRSRMPATSRGSGSPRNTVRVWSET